jgi:hypothetical protein
MASILGAAGRARDAVRFLGILGVAVLCPLLAGWGSNKHASRQWQWDRAVCDTAMIDPQPLAERRGNSETATSDNGGEAGLQKITMRSVGMAQYVPFVPFAT